MVHTSGCAHDTAKQRPTFELADILRRYLPAYLKTHRISLWQEKILYAIQVCRTMACGGHLEECDTCDYTEPAYNSCGNRHCPKCQGIKRRKWIAGRLQELLPLPYYHIVFTLPHRLNDLALYNKQLIYNLFYQACAYTLLKFGEDPKYLGAQLGFIGVLHTWGKGLCYHIHWHFIVPGGGLTKDGSWVDLPYNDKFIFPPKAMSRVVRARFIKLLKKAYYAGKIRIPDSREDLRHPVMFEYFLNDLASDAWYNHAKRPFGGPEQVVKYIGRYTHRVALSNHRLVDIDGGRILFWMKNYKKGGKKEKMELPADLFIQRFLWHILPKRFRKIRYGGFLARPVREEKLELARQAMGQETCDELIAKIDADVQEWERNNGEKCPKCQTGTLRAVEIDKRLLNGKWVAYQDSS